MVDFSNDLELPEPPQNYGKLPDFEGRGVEKGKVSNEKTGFFSKMFGNKEKVPDVPCYYCGEDLTEVSQENPIYFDNGKKAYACNVHYQEHYGLWNCEECDFPNKPGAVKCRCGVKRVVD